MTPAQRYAAAISAGLMNESEARLLEAVRRSRAAHREFYSARYAVVEDEMNAAYVAQKDAENGLTDEATPAPIAMPEGWEVHGPDSLRGWSMIGYVGTYVGGFRDHDAWVVAGAPHVPMEVLATTLRAAGYAVGKVSDG